MNSPLRILCLEDDPADAQLLRDTLETEGITCLLTRVETEYDFRTALEQGGFDLILADYTLPSFDGLSALRIALEQRPELPFIFVSGTLGEEVAIKDLKIGATDYVLKTRLARLVPAVHRALREAEARAERTRAEEALKRSEAWLADAQALTHTGSFVWDVHTGQALYLSDEWYRVFGFDPRTNMQDAWEERWQRVLPEDRAAWQAAVKRAIEENRDYELEERLRLPDGSIKYLHVMGHPIVEPSGNVVRFMGSITDITERKLAEKEAKAATTRLEGLVRSASDAIISVDSDQRIILFNQGAEKIFGYTPAEVIGRSLDLLLPEHLRELHRKHIDGFAQSPDVARQMNQRREVSGIRSDGSEFPAEASISKLNADGELVYTVILRDVTERKRTEEELRLAEQRFRTIVDHATDAFFVLEFENGLILDVNRQACESLGYTREELIGRTVFDFDAGFSPEFLNQNIRPRIEAGETVIFETRHRRKDGTLFPVEIRARTVEYGGRILNLSLALDITERKRIEEERERLRLLESELAHFNRLSLMGELTASIAHEIGQPLAGVVSNASACLRWLAADTPNLDEAREAARRIVSDGKRAGEIIARIRTLVTKKTIPKSKLDLNEIFSDVLALIADDAKRKGVTVQTEFAHDLAPVLGDRVQLQQVVLNVVMNAIEAMSETVVKQLRIRTYNSDENCVSAAVQDTGTGLAPDQIQKMFDPFYSTKPVGMGLGLSLSRSIVQNHGGKLWAARNDGPGATIQFTMPRYGEGVPGDGN